ncbi:MAG: hypothetical protein ACXWNZ_04470, partial [Vulcanimicrobiaceae bacterium]
MRTKKRGGSPVPTAMVRENDQRVGPGPGCGIAYGQLTPRRVAQWNREDVLGTWCNILARML